MEKNKEYDKVVRWLKASGQSIIDNAETIAGGYQYQCEDLILTIKINDCEAPCIQVSQEFIPEGILEEVKRINHG